MFILWIYKNTLQYYYNFLVNTKYYYHHNVDYIILHLYENQVQDNGR